MLTAIAEMPFTGKVKLFMSTFASCTEQCSLRRVGLSTLYGNSVPTFPTLCLACMPDQANKGLFNLCWFLSWSLCWFLIRIQTRTNCRRYSGKTLLHLRQTSLCSYISFVYGAVLYPNRVTDFCIYHSRKRT